MKLSEVPGLRILILAAGFSRRLGRTKALARVRGQSLLRRTAALLAPLSGEPLVIVTPPRCAAYRHQLRGLGARLVANPGRASGLSGSLRLGLRHTRWSAAALIVPVDLAGLERADIDRLLRRWRGAPRRIAARRIGMRGGTPLILPSRLYPRAHALAGDIGLRDLLAGLAESERVLVDMPSAARDVDTPLDLQQARRALRVR
jgi:molybdenum cofactor cytidylyltransferase